MNVVVITHCRALSLMYGSTLVFGSVRKAFPNAEISVVDNGSVPEALPELRAHAEHVGAFWDATRTELPHHVIVENIVAQASGTLVFVDPDVVFWEQLEGWDFGDALVAGRLIPEFKDPFSGALTAPRLHTSLLWIPSAPALREALSTIPKLNYEFNAWRPFLFKDGDTWRRYDTGASLYAALQRRLMHAFGKQALESYDHLFCGTHFPLVQPFLPPDTAREWERLHEAAKCGDYAPLKGIYKPQQAFFENLRP